MSPSHVLEWIRRVPATRWFAWLYCVWIVGVVERYILRAIGAAWDFYAFVSDVQWFAGSLAAVVIMVVACAVLGGGRALALWLALASAAAGVLVVQGQYVTSFALAAATLLMTACVGRFLIHPLFRDADRSLLFLCGLPVGLTVFALAALGVGLAGVLNPLVCWIIFAIGAGATAATLRNDAPLISNAARRLIKDVQDCSRETALLLMVLGSLSLLHLSWAAVPEIEFDALNYHLAVPRIYLEHQRVLELTFYHSYFVRNLEMLFTWMMALGGAETVKFAMFGLSLASAAAAYRLGSEMFGARAGLWAAALFYTAPLVSWESGTVYIENVLALFVTCALIAAVRWADTFQPKAMVSTALLAGVAVGAKIFAAFAFAAVAPIMLWQTFRRAPGRYSELSRRLLCALAVFTIAALPCYALFWWYTGNPIFPLLNGFFASPKWPLDNAITNAAEFGTPHTLGFLARFPFRLTLDTRKFAEDIPNGSLGLGILTAFPFAALLLAGVRNSIRVLVLSALSYLMLLFYTMHYARYVLPILPVLTVLGSGVAFHLRSPAASAIVRIALFVGIVFQFPVLVAEHRALEERFPVRAAMGAESRENFLARGLPGSGAALYLNKVAQPQDVVLTSGLENLRFYVKPDLLTPYLSVYTDPIRRIQDPALAASDVHKVLRDSDVAWLLIDRNSVSNPMPWQSFLKKDFLERYTALEYTDGFANVYRVAGASN